MPRIYQLFTLLVASVSLFLVLQALSARLSWPLAIHPDSEQVVLEHEGSPQVELATDSPASVHKPPTHAPHPSSVSTSPHFTRKIVAVGDLHGDLPNAQSVLQMAGVVDADGNWTGGVDFFVQTGDIIDRGDDTIKLYMYMDKLRAQAQAVGGTVLSHLGNHEWMNVIGDWRYVYPSEIKTFGSVAARQKMLSTGRIGKSWAANYTTASRLPLHPSLGPPNTDYDPSIASSLSHAAISFVHGGLAPTYPDLTPFPSRINELGHTLLRKLQAQDPPPAPHPPNAYPGLPHSATASEQRLYGNDGPLWYRGWALDPEDVACSRVDDVLQKTGTRRMIMGHTPDFQKIVSRCGGKIIIIDTGISHAYGGALSALSIEYSLSAAPELAVDGRQKVWVEREVVKALYVDGEVVLADDSRTVEAEVDYDIIWPDQEVHAHIGPSSTRTSSDKSVYYDAPLMHFFTGSRKPSTSSNRSSKLLKKRDEGSPISPSGTNSTIVPTHMPTPDPAHAAPDSDVAGPTPEPSVTIASTPVVNLQPQEGHASALDHPTSTSEAAAHARKRNSAASTNGVPSDSGYGSAGSNAHSRSKSLTTTRAAPTAIGETTNDDIEPIPVVWSGEEDEAAFNEQEASAAQVQRSHSRARSQSAWLPSRSVKGEDVKRSASVRSYRDRNGDQESLYTTPSGRRTPHRRTSLGGGSFAAGAGTVGPNADMDVDESFRLRSAAAEASLGKKEKLRLNKTEIKEGKRLAAVIKAESKAERKALDTVFRELADVQRMQKLAIKEEARSAVAHAKALRAFRKEELEFFAARAKYERAQADLRAQEDIRDSARQHAQEATELLQDKNREVEWFRAQKAADDRERELKLLKLAGKA
ncbi:hypothetical protein BXZ70DRAFT_1077448 [Cristinia sonorae]|uniref:Calcineurin-like phosphoesterase domain-containing protein n=1 Tax=Cristinia sonorae TaxID=1940300 RepID=A0A8K0UPP8_9AGAR|nr:hypothetical protein BXZ70DRAFT_1077448 [Cristinia sonorae]